MTEIPEVHSRDSAATRARILSAAKTQFASVGFDRTTVRAVAHDANVSPNLITRYFGGKDGLFRAATELDMRVADALQGPRETVGKRIAAHVVARWESSKGSDPMLTMLRAAMTDAGEATRMAEFFKRQASEPIARYLGVTDGGVTDGGVTDSGERAAAISVFIMGTVAQRYVLKAGPVAAATPERLTAWLGAYLQQIVDAVTIPPLHPG